MSFPPWSPSCLPAPSPGSDSFAFARSSREPFSAARFVSGVARVASRGPLPPPSSRRTTLSALRSCSLGVRFVMCPPKAVGQRKQMLVHAKEVPKQSPAVETFPDLQRAVVAQHLVLVVLRGRGARVVGQDSQARADGEASEVDGTAVAAHHDAVLLVRLRDDQVVERLAAQV